jgi:hypothetical protein
MYQDYKDLLSAFHAHDVKYLIMEMGSCFPRSENPDLGTKVDVEGGWEVWATQPAKASAWSIAVGLRLGGPSYNWASGDFIRWIKAIFI